MLSVSWTILQKKPFPKVVNVFRRIPNPSPKVGKMLSVSEADVVEYGKRLQQRIKINPISQTDKKRKDRGRY